MFVKGQKGQKQAGYAPNIAEKFHMEHFNTLSATNFIAQHYTVKVYKAWRLCRREADKETLFKLCFCLITRLPADN